MDIFTDDDDIHMHTVKDNAVANHSQEDVWLEMISEGICGYQVQRPTHGFLKGCLVVTDELGANALVLADDLPNFKAVILLHETIGLKIAAEE